MVRDNRDFNDRTERCRVLFAPESTLLKEGSKAHKRFSDDAQGPFARKRNKTSIDAYENMTPFISCLQASKDY